MKRLGAVLSQEDNTSKVWVIDYPSRTLRPSKELLALKWAGTENFWDYLLGSKFMIYTNNNHLAYIQTSMLAVSQICWLSELALFDFNIQYYLGKTNKAADALSQCPVNPEFEMEVKSENNSEDPVM